MNPRFPMRPEPATPSSPTDAPHPVAYGVDLHAGDRYTFGHFHLTERQVVEFARQWDPQRFHVDKAFADASHYHGLIASGLQTMCIYQRLATAAMYSRWSVVAGRSVREARWPRPVRGGDTLTGGATIDSVDFDARNRALVTLSVVLVNQLAKPVLKAIAEVYVNARPVAPSAGAPPRGMP